MSTSCFADGTSSNVLCSARNPATKSRKPTSPVCRAASRYKNLGRISGVAAPLEVRRAATRRFDARQREMRRPRSNAFKSGQSTGKNSVAELQRPFRSASVTEEDNPAARRGLARIDTRNPRSSARTRVGRGAVTTRIFCRVISDSVVSALRIRLIPRIVANDFDLPRRVENPAARTTICRLDSWVSIIGNMAK